MPSDERHGDPRYRDDDSISPTNEPIEESERGKLGGGEDSEPASDEPGPDADPTSGAQEQSHADMEQSTER